MEKLEICNRLYNDDGTETDYYKDLALKYEGMSAKDIFKNIKNQIGSETSFNEYMLELKTMVRLDPVKCEFIEYASDFVKNAGTQYTYEKKLKELALEVFMLSYDNIEDYKEDICSL